MSRRSRRRRRTKNGFSFFISSFFVLCIALVYFFAGDLIFPPSHEIVIPTEGEIIVSFIDVGQGDAILVRTAENAVLIDGGEHRHRQAVIDELRAAEISRLCYVVATHPHSDHIGALTTILRDFEIGTLLLPDVTNNSETFENFLEAIENHDIEIKIPIAGENILAGNIFMQIISPPSENFPGINDNSIVLRMVHGETAFLFTGDAESAAENFMLANYNLRADVLKVSHHGSRTSTSDAFLDAVSPAIAVISVGANNRYSHPHTEVLARLSARGAKIYRTDEIGTVRLITDGERIYFN
jgi:beta-lactamase superfamily II metal-dependent hydrolase